LNYPEVVVPDKYSFFELTWLTATSQKWFSGVVEITPSGRAEGRLPPQNLHKVPTEESAGAKARLFFARYGTTKVVP
jgi:hypothetical protein